MKTIQVPPELDLIAKPTDSLQFFRDLRQSILVSPCRRVSLDHRPLARVSPAAAIVLIAELFRADHYAPRCAKFALIPKSGNEEVAEVLEKIGYWKYFGIRYDGQPRTNRQFMIHNTGNRITPKLVRNVIVHFREAVQFTPSEEKRLYVALIECLDNVMNHAYPYRRAYDPPCLRHQWWVLAYRDAETHEVCVCFYDQGVGIPETIKKRAEAQMVLIPESDGELVIRAVLEGYRSRHGGETRGTGLPSLKGFIDEAHSGELVIVTNGVQCVFPHGERPSATSLPNRICGTLIQWRFRR